MSLRAKGQQVSSRKKIHKMNPGRPNPWLEIKAEDYEGHMDLPEVDQFAPLRSIFAESLRNFAPGKVAIPGCATGNGIEAVDFKSVEKLYALDINPEFLKILKGRFSGDSARIETIECDLDREDPGLSGIDLVFAALIFEYVDPAAVMKKISRWLSHDGVLVAVLQMPCEDIPEISPSPFRELEKLSSIMKLVDPEEILSLARSNGLSLHGRKRRKLRSGKEFCEMVFRADGPR